MKSEIITIAGSIGSGKSSTAKGVAAALGYEHFSSGDFLRRIAAERGVSIEEFMVQAEKQRSIDLEVDAVLRRMGAEQNRFVIDSRLAWHWMPQSFKVYLNLDLDTAAERIYEHIQREGRVSQTGASVAEVRDKVALRFATDIKRYHDLYDLDYTDPAHYDLVIDTRTHDLAAVTEQVLQAYKVWRQ